MSFLSAILGMDASHNAGQAQHKADGLYNTLGTLGTNNSQAYGQVPGAINNFKQGVNNNPLLSLFQQGNTSSPLVQALGQAYGLNIPSSAQMGPGGADMGRQPGSPAQGPGMNGGQSLMPQDAYGLSQPQQIQLNTQLNQLDQAKQTAIANYKSAFSGRGGGDPGAMAAGMAAIEEQFAAMAEDYKGSFADKANQQRQQGLQALLSGGQSAQTQQNAGNLSIADLLMSQGNAGAQQLESAAGAHQNNANTQGANATAAQGGLLNLAGTLAGIYA